MAGSAGRRRAINSTRMTKHAGATSPASEVAPIMYQIADHKESLVQHDSTRPRAEDCQRCVRGRIVGSGDDQSCVNCGWSPPIESAAYSVGPRGPRQYKRRGRA
jgi:hypothetical protein